jgi:methionine aminopeptidase
VWYCVRVLLYPCHIDHWTQQRTAFSASVTHLDVSHTHTGSYRDVLWPDQWTAVTYDGSRSAQFEHTMLVTETGVELLTARVGAPTDRIVWDRDTFQR